MNKTGDSQTRGGGSMQGDSSAEPNGELELYRLFRDYIEHEDELTNNRLNWNFTIQGFLFIAWVYCVQKYAELSTSIATATNLSAESRQHLLQLIQEIHWASLIIGSTGLVVSLFVGLGAFAAQLAIVDLQAQWEKNHERFDRTSNTHLKHRLDLPELTGGGNRLAHVLGFGAPIAIPILFVCVWGILLTWQWR